MSKNRSIFYTLSNLSSFEKLIAGALFIIVVVSGTKMFYTYNVGSFIEVPRSGGVHKEGIVGTPRFINPLLAVSRADRDLTSLVYAGLLTRDAEGNITPELARGYEISEDGLQYTVHLKENLTFHDGTPLTAKDVMFTVKQAGNEMLRSPVFPNWEGVQIQQVDDYTVIFTLTEPYAPFIENLTLGILPAHIWEGLSPEKFSFSDFNIKPVGAGSFMFGEIERDGSGIPLQYRLNKFDGYALGEPYLHAIDFLLFNNNDDALEAYAEGKVHAVNSVTPSNLEIFLNSDTEVKTAVHRAPLLRTFGIFFNHNKQRIFLEDEVREALEEATPKKALIGEILRGYGTELDCPLPPFITAFESTSNTNNSTTSVNSIERARNILEAEGWEKGEDGVYTYENDDSEVRLSLSFSTVNTPELIRAAERIAESWREVGIEVELKVFDPTDLAQSVIRPRRFEVLLFGMEIGHELDLYAFWHSSQRNDPGLNIAQYADIEADAFLEKMRVEKDDEKRKELYQNFAELLKQQRTAIFLYSPDFIYVVNESVQNVQIHPLSDTSERFDTVHLWHKETDHVWPFVRNFFIK